ncbi:lytic transglycosylase domain-containing protein [Sedimentitalea sp. JM2-8]|uniref:Lytic transglycosylase domain-containing protein n=1 Tax=Sedimentitalea xiamensis TaxID=3050037 RepID=A0ABT7FJU9_9RHOB|nr:lytic transglycosylase domain-containing protein [Sedimentitalea xiamensis]MDK3075416.1 lytic transglycosylase domain-containing protein [Sedimentitalea xiamensis]
MQRWLIISAAFCGLAPPTVAQGVPTRDNSGIAQLATLLKSLGKDLGVQRDRLSTGTELARVQAEQLRVLEDMTTAITGHGFDIDALETHAGFPAPEIYPPRDTSSMDSRLFGEGRETIEMMIVRVAGEYAGVPGVARAGLSPTQWRCLFQALIKQESRFSITAQSPAGAYGLTQLMPGTAADLGVDRHDVIDNLRGGARYITTQLDTFGSIPHALAAYNAGPGRVREYGGVPPFPETQGYVRNITHFMGEYLAVIGGADALGTLTPVDMALAEYSNISDASLYYSADAHATTEHVVNRLAAIIRQIDAQPDVKAAIEINTYARAEIGRILSLRLRLIAANETRAAAQAQYLAVDRIEERGFMTMEVTE